MRHGHTGSAVPRLCATGTAMGPPWIIGIAVSTFDADLGHVLSSLHPPDCLRDEAERDAVAFHSFPVRRWRLCAIHCRVRLWDGAETALTTISILQSNIVHVHPESPGSCVHPVLQLLPAA